MGGKGLRSKESIERDALEIKPKLFVPYTEEQLWKMTRQQITANLTEQQARWCEVYVKSFNIDLAAIKAGYSKKSAASAANRLRKREDINSYIAWLKLRVTETLDIRPIDILEQYAKIGFADITDYVTLKNGRLTLMDSDLIDGQVVKSYKVGPQGTTVELHDKMGALRHLEQFFAEMPKSWQQRIEERRMEIAEEKLQLERDALGRMTDEQSELGSALIQALRGVANAVWNGEGEDPEDFRVEDSDADDEEEEEEV